MPRAFFRRIFPSLVAHGRRSKPNEVRRCRPRLEGLEDRLAPASLNIDAAGNAVFIPGDSTLPGASGGNDTIVLSRNASTGSYRIQTIGDAIHLSGAGAGAWSGGGSETVTGPDSSINSWTFNLGDGNNNLLVGASDSYHDAIIDPLTSIGAGTTDTFTLLESGGGIALNSGDILISNYTTINIQSNTILGGSTAGHFTLTARDNISFGFNPAAATIVAGILDVHAGTDGTGTVSFSGPTEVDATTQNWLAGTGLGGSSTATVDLITNNPAFRDADGVAAPSDFIFRQGAAIGDTNLPAAAQFGGTPPANYGIRSDDAAVSIGSPGKVAGSNLAVTANLTIDLPAFTGPDALASLMATTPRGITLFGNITTTAATGQVYDGPVLLTANTALTGAAGSPINLISTVNSSGASRSLNISTSGTTQFGGTVMNLSSLTTDATGITEIGADVTATSQVYNDNVVLTGNVTLTSSVTFNGAVDDDIVAPNRDMTINSTGAATFNSAVGGMTPLGSLAVNAAAGTKVNGGLVRTVGDQSYGNRVTVGGGATVVFETITAGHAIAFGATGAPTDFLDLGATDATITADGIDWGTGSPTNFAVVGSGTLTLQPFGDATSIGVGGAAGTLQLSASEIEGLGRAFRRITIGRASGTGEITVNAVTFFTPIYFRTPGGSIVISGVLRAFDFGAITLTADVITGGAGIDNGRNVLTVDAGTSAVFRGVIVGSGGLTNRGSGVTTLLADNSYTGPTTQNAGTLLVDGHLVATQITVMSGTLGGVGTTRLLTISGGTLAPGTSPGILRVADSVQFTDGMLQVEVKGKTAGTAYDQIVVEGNVKLGEGIVKLVIAPTAFTPQPGTHITLIHSVHGVTGYFTGLPEGAKVKVGGVTMRITYQGGASGKDVVLIRPRLRPKPPLPPRPPISGWSH